MFVLFPQTGDVSNIFLIILKFRNKKWEEVSITNN